MARMENDSHTPPIAYYVTSNENLQTRRSIVIVSAPNVSVEITSAHAARRAAKRSPTVCYTTIVEP